MTPRFGQRMAQRGRSAWRQIDDAIGGPGVRTRLRRVEIAVGMRADDDRGGMEEIVVIERGDRRAGLVVDELTGQEDIVVKSFDAVREGLPLFSGATILPDGAPALIVDVGSLL